MGNLLGSALSNNISYELKKEGLGTGRGWTESTFVADLKNWIWDDPSVV